MTDLTPFADCFCPPGQNDEKKLVFAGLPDDTQSSYRRGPAEAPPRIRQAYNGESYSPTPESEVDLGGQVADLGDWPAGDSWDETYRSYQRSASALFSARRVPFLAGGDHAVTVPIVAALEVLAEPIHVLQIDAHGDLYDELDGSSTSHACMAARILEMPHVASLTQLGIRHLNPPQKEMAARHRDRLRTYKAYQLSLAWPKLDHLDRLPVYVTIDLDAFDPAHAPGVSHQMPGGLTPRSVLNMFLKARWRLLGMDAVEVNPRFDIHDQTSILAGRLLHEGMGLAARRGLAL